MPPPPSRFSASGPSRMTANPAKPVGRYRPGKAVAEEPSESEEDDEEEEVHQDIPETSRPKATSFPAGRAAPAPKARPPPVEEDSDEEGFVTEEEDDEAEEANQPHPTRNAVPDPEVQQVLNRAAPALPREEDLEEEEESDEEESSEEEESSSEEDAPQRKLLRPTFIKKSDRNAKIESPAPSGNHFEAGKLQSDPASTNGMPASAEDDLTEEENRRRELADLMITDKLERDAIARAAGKKSWDDDDEVAPEDMVDDTDGLDPEAELAAWKLRELKRLKRDREAIEEREKELEEIERRRNLTAEEREREDAEYLAAQKEERESGRGKAGFMQRYHHKGAFFQDDETAKEILARRDLMGASYVDEVKNRDALPEYMQIRDMAKLGRKGRSKYRDLRAEDTGRWADYGRLGQKKGFSGEDERFRPDDDRRGAQGPTGANAGTLGPRRNNYRKVQEAPEGPRAFRHERDRDSERADGDSYRPSRRHTSADDDNSDEDYDRRSRYRRRPSSSRSRSRSRRQHPHEDGNRTRKRSLSPDRDRDKRRRVEAS